MLKYISDIFVGGTSREACEERIVLYVYFVDDAPEIKTMEINGIRLTTKHDCKKTLQNKKNQKKLKRVNLCVEVKRKQLKSRILRLVHI